ncbi:MAG: hypothetical protein AB7U73_01260 [Pirellulales bacterium]
MTKKPTKAEATLAETDWVKNNLPPEKREPPKPEDFELAAGLGCSIDEAAAYLGIATAEFVDYLKRDDYRAAWERGPAATDVKVTEALFTNAQAGNVEAIKFWLTNRRPDQWTTKPRAAAKPSDVAAPPPEPTPTPSEPEPEAASADPLAGVVLKLPESAKRNSAKG